MIRDDFGGEKLEALKIPVEEFTNITQILDEEQCYYLCGDPGIGKTTLAREYAYHIKSANNT